MGQRTRLPRAAWRRCSALPRQRRPPPPLAGPPPPPPARQQIAAVPISATGFAALRPLQTACEEGGQRSKQGKPAARGPPSWERSLWPNAIETANPCDGCRPKPRHVGRHLGSLREAFLGLCILIVQYQLALSAPISSRLARHPACSSPPRQRAQFPPSESWHSLLTLCRR